MTLLRAALILVSLLAAACAPRVEGLGAGVQAPAIVENGFEMADGFLLPADIALPENEPEAVLLALHGFNDYAGAFRDSAPKWAAKGIAVYAYDQRGFGRGDGRGLWHGAEAMTSDLAAVTDLLRARYPNRPLTVLGESMGAAVVIAGLTDPSLPTPDADRFVLSAPAVWGRAVMPWWQRWPLAAFSHIVPWLEVAPRIRRRPSDNIEMLRALSRDPWMIRRTRIDSIHGLVGLMDRAHAGIPNLGENTLLLYGANEDILPESAWKGAVSRLPPNGGWRLAIYDTGFHMLTRDLNADIVIGDIGVFAKDPTAPLPSGRETDGTTLPRARE